MGARSLFSIILFIFYASRYPTILVIASSVGYNLTSQLALDKSESEESVDLQAVVEQGTSFLCYSNKSLDFCSITSPVNQTYQIIKQDKNLTCFNRDSEDRNYSQICLKIEGKKCLIVFEDIQEKDIGTWRCNKVSFTELEQDRDAVVIRNLSVVQDLIFFDSFNITSSVITGKQKIKDLRILYTLVSVVCFSLTAIVLIMLRIFMSEQTWLRKVLQLPRK